jgi:hypothetical protein
MSMRCEGTAVRRERHRICLDIYCDRTLCNRASFVASDMKGDLLCFNRVCSFCATVYSRTCRFTRVFHQTMQELHDELSAHLVPTITDHHSISRIPIQ